MTHPFKPMDLYVVGDPNPLWTDWCRQGTQWGDPPFEHIPLEICGELATHPIHLPSGDDEG